MCYTPIQLAVESFRKNIQRAFETGDKIDYEIATSDLETVLMFALAQRVEHQSLGKLSTGDTEPLMGSTNVLDHDGVFHVMPYDSLPTGELLVDKELVNSILSIHLDIINKFKDEAGFEGSPLSGVFALLTTHFERLKARMEE